ncbi:M23 family metallopeptidase [Kitasatospora sp. NPDC054939]
MPAVPVLTAALARCCLILFFAQLVADLVLDFSVLWGWIPLGAGLLLQWFAGRQSAPRSVPEPIEVAPPVAGRWSALNSPADRVPSHGTHTLAQTFAVDLVAEPEDRPRPAFGWWPPSRSNGDFPAFGAPLLAVADATVVRVADRHRDHRSRNSYPALAYFVVESLARMLGGPGRIIGNHVVLDLGGGTHALYAHVRRGSAVVRVGDRVTTGQLLGDCGNSGNSTEPHVHFQLMDGPDPRSARGLPFTWRGAGVPAAGEVFTVPEPAAATA